MEEFVAWLKSGTSLKDPSDEALKSLVDFRWPHLDEAFSLLDRLDTKLQESQIGYLELKGSTADDDKKIFDMINTAGTPEPPRSNLSAKPDWNNTVTDPHPNWRRAHCIYTLPSAFHTKVTS